jgi:hypothetical protein
MPSRSRVAVPISAAIHERLKAEAVDRGLSITRLTEILIERGFGTLPPVPKVDDCESCERH